MAWFAIKKYQPSELLKWIKPQVNRETQHMQHYYGFRKVENVLNLHIKFVQIPKLNKIFISGSPPDGIRDNL